MASQKPKKQDQNQAPQAPAQMASVHAIPHRCPVENCGLKATRMNFCKEHFTWFKEGLVNKNGEKPKDFDKKYMAFKRKIAA